MQEPSLLIHSKGCGCPQDSTAHGQRVEAEHNDDLHLR